MGEMRSSEADIDCKVKSPDLVDRVEKKSTMPIIAISTCRSIGSAVGGLDRGLACRS